MTPQFPALDEVPVCLPEDLLMMPPEEYADLFNRAVAFRSQIADQLVAVQGQIAEVEHEKRVFEAELRRDARLAALALSRQQVKDELLLDTKYDAMCRRERELHDARRRLGASHDAVTTNLKGLSRLIELRRQEMVLNAPTVVRGRESRR